MGRRKDLLARSVLAATLCAGCFPQRTSPTSVVSASGDETPIPPRALRVVSHERAVASGLSPRPVTVPFGAGKDGTRLIASLLEDAERQGAELVSDIQIVLASARDGAGQECVTEVVPETQTQSRMVPGEHRMVPVQAPVSRMVTEQQYRCHMVT